jgi:hypothetical protein
MNFDFSKLDYPGDAAQVRDLIRDLLCSQADQGSGMDTGGGMGSADLCVKLGGVEYIVTVQRLQRSTMDFPYISQEEAEAALREQQRLIDSIR